MKQEIDITKALHTQREVLTESERIAVWENVLAETYKNKKPVVSPYFTLFSLSRKVTALTLAVCLLLSSGTVYASDQARPGEKLFVIDRALEETSVVLLPTQALKEKMRGRQKAERVRELREVVERGGLSTQLDAAAIELEAFMADTQLEGSAQEAFLEEVVRELGDERSLRYGFKKVRAEERDGERTVEIREEDDERRFEYRDDRERIRIREKDGVIEVRTKSIDEDDSDDSDDGDGSESNSDDDTDRASDTDGHTKDETEGIDTDDESDDGDKAEEDEDRDSDTDDEDGEDRSGSGKDDDKDKDDDEREDD